MDFPAPDGPITALIDVAPSLMIRADGEQLYRVLSNLVRNARQAIEAAARPGTIEIGVAFASIVAFGIALGEMLIVIVEAGLAEHRVKSIFCIGQRSGLQLGRTCCRFQQLYVVTYLLMHRDI